MFANITFEWIHFVLFALLGSISLLLLIAMVIGCRKLIQYASGAGYDLSSTKPQKNTKAAYVHHSSSIQYYDMRDTHPQQTSQV